jgi:hypothetical protein
VLDFVDLEGELEVVLLWQTFQFESDALEDAENGECECLCALGKVVEENVEERCRCLCAG